MEKNIEYLQIKRQKVQSEINLLLVSNKVRIVDSSIRDSTKILKIKNFQLKVIDFLEASSVDVIYETLQKEKIKLCKSCQKGLLKGDLKCQQDLMQFVFCDMMRHALVITMEIVP